MLAATPEPPYVAVIFTALLGSDTSGYAAAVAEMRRLAHGRRGFLGIEAAGGKDDPVEITVSYWATDADAAAWKEVAQHVEAQRQGRERWYESYEVRIAHVERAYGVGRKRP